MNREDRRVARTRDGLGDALVALMQEKSFDEITVQEVLDRAGVGRSTFYVHFSGKEDLFLSDVEEFLEKVATSLQRTGAERRRLAPVRELFTHVGEWRRFHAALAASGKGPDVEALGRGMFARSIEERLGAAGVEMGRPRQAAYAAALAGSLFSLLDWWIDQGMQADPREMDELFHQLAWSGLT